MHEVMWWVTVSMYMAAAGACWFTGRTSTSHVRWNGAAAAVLLVGANKLFELTSVFTRFLRKIAWNHDWYMERSFFQFVVIGVIFFGVIAGAFFVWRLLLRRRYSAAFRVVAISILLLAAYSMIRSVSLHALDSLLYQKKMGIRLNWVIELGGIISVIVAAIWERMEGPRGNA